MIPHTIIHHRAQIFILDSVIRPIFLIKSKKETTARGDRFFVSSKNDYKIMKIRVSSRKTGTRIPKDHFM